VRSPERTGPALFVLLVSAPARASPRQTPRTQRGHETGAPPPEVNGAHAALRIDAVLACASVPAGTVGSAVNTRPN
jgi:hypothetical protein